MERITTGITALDEVLQGGFPAGSTTLLIGRPGSGKSIFANQTAFGNASEHSKVLYFSTLSEPQVNILKYQQEFRFFDQARFQKSVIYADLGSVLRKRGTVQALTVIDELLKQHQPKLVVVDTIRTIAEMINSLTDFRAFLLDLSLRLSVWGCTTLLLGEYPEEEIDIRPESAIADGVIFLSGSEERLQQKRYLRILKMRGTAYSGGEIVFRINQNGIEAYPRLSPAATVQDYPQYTSRLATGIPELDSMLGGGIPRGSTTMVSGPSGSGKTKLALSFIHAGLQAGENALFVSFEENPEQLLMDASRLGLDLVPYLSGGHLHIEYISPIELDADISIHQVQRLARRMQAERLVIDSISSFEIGMPDKVKYTDYLWALTDYFKLQGVSTLFTHEMHDAVEVSEITKHGVSYLADNIIILRYLEQDWEVRNYLRVVKMRSSQHSRTLREMVISPTGISLGASPLKN